ncbi:hypothetical protein MAP00_003801 [Monascus purpureus]|nr:hypothetical protein MAP00_003801 [Monascus purpureus]
MKRAPREIIYNFLKKQSLNNCHPLGQRELTFIESCRFVDETLSQEGIKTVSHLWKMRKIVSGFSDKFIDELDLVDGLNDHQRRCLRHLADKLGSGNLGSATK